MSIEDIPDSEKIYGEERKYFTGEVNGVIYKGVMTLRAGDQRLITARKAGKKEREKFESKRGKTMHEKTDPGGKRLDETKSTCRSVQGGSTHIIEDYDPEIDYIPETNYDNAIWVRGHEIAIYSKEACSKGTNFVKRRLTREGHKIESGGWVYVPPKNIE